MGRSITGLRSVAERLDCLAERYEAAVDADPERRQMDRMVSGLLCLWTVMQVGALSRYLQAYPLF